jgi:hypothetical protein
MVERIFEKASNPLVLDSAQHNLALFVCNGFWRSRSGLQLLLPEAESNGETRYNDNDNQNYPERERREDACESSFKDIEEQQEKSDDRADNNE